MFQTTNQWIFGFMKTINMSSLESGPQHRSVVLCRAETSVLGPPGSSQGVSDLRKPLQFFGSGRWCLKSRNLCIYIYICNFIYYILVQAPASINVLVHVQCCPRCCKWCCEFLVFFFPRKFWCFKFGVFFSHVNFDVVNLAFFFT